MVSAAPMDFVVLQMRVFCGTLAEFLRPRTRSESRAERRSLMMLYAVGSFCCCCCTLHAVLVAMSSNYRQQLLLIFVSPQNEFRAARPTQLPLLHPPSLPHSLLRCVALLRLLQLPRDTQMLLRDTLASTRYFRAACLQHLCGLSGHGAVCVWICLIARKPKTIPSNPLDPADSPHPYAPACPSSVAITTT